MSLIKEAIEWGGNDLIIETGRIAKQADGSVLISYGKTTVLCTCVYSKQTSDESGFFPLTVNYQEKFYAAGKIPGGFVKREGKPSDKETLVSRLIDRPIRPLFKDGFLNETQIVCTVLSYDELCSPEITALIGASAAVVISGAPFITPVAGCNVAYSEKDGFLLNPQFEKIKDNKLNLTVAGTKDGVLMVESEADELSEEVMLNAVMFGHKSIQPVIEMIERLRKAVNKKELKVKSFKTLYSSTYDKIIEIAKNDIIKVLNIKEKLKRRDGIEQICIKIVQTFAGQINESIIKTMFEEIVSNIMREQVLNNKKRIDGRAMTEIRPITCEVGALPGVHGSALFTRGETQALVVTTLGSANDEQIVSDITGDKRERFFLHYNFPSFAVGEIGKIGSPGRREIGHGKLAWKALRYMIPEKFQYAIRVVSEILESNGSSSMATVCGASLSLMDAGIPVKKHVAGIAMGLIKEGRKCVVLSDINGDEDHLGDMDFKVAGTIDGITALQMDIKITSIGKKIIETALKQAHNGRLHIIEKMNNAIQNSRAEMRTDAPKIESITIDKDQIKSLIGPGGKTIREICDKSRAKIEISDDGIVSIFAQNNDAVNIAKALIREICNIPTVGEVFSGTVVKITDFGAFISISGGKDGLLRVKHADKLFTVGQAIDVIISGIDEKGRIKLSWPNGD